MRKFCRRVTFVYLCINGNCKQTTWRVLTRREILLKIFSIIFLVVFPHFVPLPFYSYAIVCFLLIIWILKRQNQTLRNIGLKRGGLTFKTLIAGIISAIILNRLVTWIYYPVIHHFFAYNISDYTEYNFIKEKLFNYLLVLFASWIIGGFYEELVFRGYIQSTFQNIFRSTKNSFWASGILTTILFGIYHWQQGVFGIVHSALAGIFWTFMLRRFKGNLWYPIISHAAYDTITLTMIYLGILGK